VEFDAFFDFSQLGKSDGSFVSSAANFHADSEVFSSDFVVRRFAGPRRPEREGHFSSSLSASSIRAMSDGWKILSRPTGV
jgi:hypothetical protein